MNPKNKKEPFVPRLPRDRWDFGGVSKHDLSAVCMWEYSLAAFSKFKGEYDEKLAARHERGYPPSEFDEYPSTVVDVANSPLGPEAMRYLFGSSFRHALSDKETMNEAREFYSIIKWESPSAFEPLSLSREKAVGDDEIDRSGSLLDHPAPHRVNISGIFDLRFRDAECIRAVSERLKRARAKTGIRGNWTDFEPINSDGSKFPARYGDALMWLAVFRLHESGLKARELERLNPYKITFSDDADFRKRVRWARGIIEWLRTNQRSHLSKLPGAKK